MTRRILFTSILAAQFAMFCATPTPTKLADDPFPCGDCDASSGPAQLASVVKLSDDPFPCGDCDASSGPAQLS
jgi:hypothetical protein